MTDLQPPQRSRSDHRSRERNDLLNLVHSCLTLGTPSAVNLSVPKHFITAPVLRRAVFNADYRGKSLPVVFTDGSRPPAFPVGCLSKEGAPADEAKAALLGRHGSVLKVGTQSMRHPDLDYLIDLYVTRNTELAREDATTADVEQVAFDSSVRFFSDAALDDCSEIWVYHTGFEPMIVGFYRGLVKSIEVRRLAGKKRLIVRPWLYEPIRGAQSNDAGDDDEETPRYSPDSPGAKLESYNPYEPWY